jgi:hypothetical protein
MRDFLRHLKAAWNYGRQFPYFAEADSEEFWTTEDAKALRHFMTSYVGQKLKVRLTNYMTKMANAAVQNAACSPYHNGQASGVAACVAAIDAHLPLEAEQPEAATDSEFESAMASA